MAEEGGKIVDDERELITVFFSISHLSRQFSVF